MSVLQDFIDFFYSNGKIMLENIYVFLSWGFLCVIGTYAIVSSKIKHLKKEISKYKTEYEVLKNKYSQLDDVNRLLMGAEEFPMTSATVVSKKINRK